MIGCAGLAAAFINNERLTTAPIIVVRYYAVDGSNTVQDTNLNDKKPCASFAVYYNLVEAK